MKPEVSTDYVTPYGKYVKVCVWGSQLSFLLKKKKEKREEALQSATEPKVEEY